MKLSKLLIISSILLATAVVAKTLTVMTIDTGLDFTNTELKKHVPIRYQNPEWKDVHGHGSNVVGTIQEDICDSVEIIPCKFYTSNSIPNINFRQELKCLKIALQNKIDVINYSGGGRDDNKEEEDLIGQFLKAGGVLITAAGNNSSNLDELGRYYPACYKYTNVPGKLIAVGALDKDGHKAYYTNYGNSLEWELGDSYNWCLDNKKCLMQGTSQATARRTNRFIKDWCKKNK